MSTEQPKIYHNNRCSKSRAALQLLEERGYQPEVIQYMKDPLDKATLLNILALLEMSPRELLRSTEGVYKEAGLEDPDLSDDELLNAMLECPSLMQRPIVVYQGKAALGRPTENIEAIL